LISLGAGGLGDADHPAVDMFGHAGDHAFRRFAEPLRPVLPHQVVIAADAAGGNDHGLGTQREVAGDLARAALSPLGIVRFEDRARDAIDGAVGHGQGIDAVAEPERQPSLRLRFASPSFERLDDAGAGAPGHMEPGHRIAMAHGIVTAALRPADHGEEPKPHGAEPCAFFRLPRRPHRLPPSASARDLRRGRSPPTRSSPAGRGRNCP